MIKTGSARESQWVFWVVYVGLAVFNLAIMCVSGMLFSWPVSIIVGLAAYLLFIFVGAKTGDLFGTLYEKKRICTFAISAMSFANVAMLYIAITINRFM